MGRPGNAVSGSARRRSVGGPPPRTAGKRKVYGLECESLRSFLSSGLGRSRSPRPGASQRQPQP